MWPAILLLWVSLLWTLLCLLFYRDRAVIVEASLPAWIVSIVLWLVVWSPVSVFKIDRWWNGRQTTAPKKKSRARSAAAKTARPQRKKKD